jgi:hypothetical protein
MLGARRSDGLTWVKPLDRPVPQAGAGKAVGGKKAA